MLESLLAIAAYLLPFVVDWLTGRKMEGTPDEKCREDVQAMHNAVAAGDSDAISGLFDELRIPQPPGKRPGDTCGPGG